MRHIVPVKGLVTARKGVMPLALVHPRMQGRRAIGAITAHVQFVGHFMNYHVACTPRLANGFPRQDDRPLMPGLAGQHRPTAMHHAIVSAMRTIGNKSPFVKNHRIPTVVPLKAQLENGHTGHGRHLQTHGIGHSEPTTTGNALARQEPQGKGHQGLSLSPLITGLQRPVGNRRLPLLGSQSHAPHLAGIPPLSPATQPAHPATPFNAFNNDPFDHNHGADYAVAEARLC